MAHAREPNEAGARDHPCERDAAARRDKRVMQPVDDERGNHDTAQLGGAVRLGGDGRELAKVTRGIVAAVPAAASQFAQLLLVERKATGADQAEDLDGRGDGGGPVGCRAPPQQPG